MPCTSIRRFRRHASQSISRSEGRKARRVHGADGHVRRRHAGRSSRPRRRSGKNYMMMETVVYTREFLFVKELYETGQLGRIQFFRGAHQQEMAGWPGYWEGLPPMHYGTHAISPLLALPNKEAEYVSCFGSGRISDDLAMNYPVRRSPSKRLTLNCVTRIWSVRATHSYSNGT